MLQEAIAARALPGAAFGVLQNGSVLGVEAVGRFTYDAASPVVTPQTPYDLASVSKVLATTAAAMLLWQRGVLSLDSPLEALLPQFNPEGDAQRSRVTLRLLLAHSSGLPAWVPVFETCRAPQALLDALFTLPLEAEPGTRMAYSDPGFILLGKALEALAGEPLDAFASREIFAPLAMRKTQYCPAPCLRAAIPPTEDDLSFRQRIIQGEVQDENCWVLGGVSGHAGLFAPVRDVLRFAEAMLAPLYGRATELFHGETVATFTRRAALPPGSSRALGWDTPSGPISSSGTLFSPAAFGHLGFAGTSLWVDPTQDLAVVLLTNRTFPTRENKQIQQVRPLFHDAVLRQLRRVPSAQI